MPFLGTHNNKAIPPNFNIQIRHIGLFYRWNTKKYILIN